MQQSLKQQPRLKCKFCLVADASSTTEFVCTFTSPATVLIIRMANWFNLVDEEGNISI